MNSMDGNELISVSFASWSLVEKSPMESDVVHDVGPYICLSEGNLAGVGTMNYSIICNQTGTLVSPCKL